MFSNIKAAEFGTMPRISIFMGLFQSPQGVDFKVSAFGKAIDCSYVVAVLNMSLPCFLHSFVIHVGGFRSYPKYVCTFLGTASLDQALQNILRIAMNRANRMFLSNPVERFVGQALGNSQDNGRNTGFSFYTRNNLVKDCHPFGWVEILEGFPVKTRSFRPAGENGNQTA
jgi:hypothetical protein